jgi:hypothetical protein
MVGWLVYVVSVYVGLLSYREDYLNCSTCIYNAIIIKHFYPNFPPLPSADILVEPDKDNFDWEFFL